jgi:Ca2+-binding EF-hand superfamily protein
MIEDEIKYFREKFDEYDHQKSGHIGIDEFLLLYRDCECDQNKTKEEAQITFNALDISNQNCISKEEFVYLAKSIKSEDKNYLYKMLFKAFDKNRSKFLEADELIDYMKFCKKHITKAQAEVIIKNKNHGNGKGISFAQLYKFLTHQEIDPNTDPYDGKLLKRGCCLLLKIEIIY